LKAIDYSICLKKNAPDGTEIGLEDELTSSEKAETYKNGHVYLENLIGQTLLDEFKANTEDYWKGDRK